MSLRAAILCFLAIVILAAVGGKDHYREEAEDRGAQAHEWSRTYSWLTA